MVSSILSFTIGSSAFVKGLLSHLSRMVSGVLYCSVSRIFIIGLSYNIIEVQKNDITINLKQTYDFIKNI